MTLKSAAASGGEEKYSHFPLLQEVAEGLDKHSTVGYENSVRCMKHLAEQPLNPECITFWNGHVFRMVQILLEQRPHVLGQLEKSCVEDTTTITVKLMPKYPLRMDLILRIFDSQNTYYTGSRSNYQNYLGLPQLRLNVLAIFAENGGFERIREIYCPDSAPWPPSQEMLVIVKALKDSGTNAPAEICADIEQYVVRNLMDMSEDQLKKESTDHLSSLITHLIQPRNSSMSDDSRYQFWLQHTLKMMNCSSIVLKLYAWDQVNDIIREALNTKPHPQEFIVRAAGNPNANGAYAAAFGAGETPKYVKPKGTPTGAPELTLFRCTMRSKMKWWFISEADPDKPGTDKDIDYYQHKSVGEQQEREPPLSGWSLALGAGSPGIYPPPVLEGRGHFIPNPDVPLDSFLISKIPVWIQEGAVLNVVFGTTMHRELILRSRKLFNFLADVNALTEAHLHMIWKASISCHDSEISDEIQALLGALSLHLNDSLYSFLMELLSGALKSEEGGKEGREHRFSKVAAFVEKFHKEFSRCLYQLSTHSGIQFLSLIWSLYRHPLSETSKAQSVFEEMLSSCLHERWNGGNVVAYVTECTEQLQSFASLEKVNETQVSRSLQSLVFMLSHESMRGADTDLSAFGVAEILHGELLRFVNAQRSLCLERRGGDATWYKTQLAKRLHLIRVYYGLSPVISMTRAMIVEMWDLLYHPAEREELFVFFKEAGVRTASAESAFGLAECVYVYKSMICSPDVDWVRSTEGMYDCFTTYSDGMKKMHSDEELPNICIETLWRITLSTPLDSIANKAVVHLLRAYDSFDVTTNTRIMERVFSHLAEFDEKTKNASETVSDVDIRRVGRCVNILSSSIADGTGSVQVPHITRGCMNRIRVTVVCRIQPAYYDARTQKKPTEQVLNVDLHPMSSVMALKTKICSSIDGTKPDRVYLNFGNHYVSSPDNTQLSAIGIVDGSEVIASMNLNNYNASVGYDDDFDDYKKDTGLHAGNLVSGHAMYFDILFSLLDKFTTSAASTAESEIGKAVWKIMMEIPTQPAMLKSVIDCSSSLPPTSTQAWDTLLRTNVNTSSASMTYLLQIIDGLIQPAVEIPGEQVEYSAFIASGGFTAVLGLFLSKPETETATEFRKMSDTIALHIIHFCLFGQSVEKEVIEPPLELLAEINASSAEMLRTLLSAANFAAEGGQTGSVQDALVTLTYLLKSPEIAEQLTSNPQAKSLLTSVLRHESKKVRDMAAEFAVQVGKSQKVVFDWLLAEVDGMSTSEKNCEELFAAFRVLLIEQRSTLSGGAELKTLATMLSNKLLTYPHTEASGSHPFMLIGCLTLLKNLIDLDISALDDTKLGKDFVTTVLSDFLFAMPTPDVDRTALCVRPLSRKATFAALIAFLHQRPENFPAVLEQLHKLMELSAVQLRHAWGISSFHDHRRLPKVGFTGLKNQGCTCYSNSLLQQLFMNLPFRQAVMSTPLRSSHRSSLWHMNDKDLVGKEIMLEWDGGSWHRAQVITFDIGSGLHVIRYRDLNGELGEEISFNIRGGAARLKKETGRVKLVREPLPGAESNAPSESETNAYRILEQLQRTFCFLEHSKQAYIDPRPLIEACKTLNLNYDVYHQNDASEFCDQLLDRLETAMRGKHTGVDVWKENVLLNIFGGGMLYQKIPEECEFYESDRRECGHWQSTREEAFLKCELIIRGKENIEESLEQLVEGELMNGDNKIMCEKCNTKKDTVRRTCFDVLPNTLIIHLKRFDLDFQTFETVKLNNKIAFPNRLSMFKYTKEGMEAEEKAKILMEEGGSVPNNPDLSRDLSDIPPPVGSRSNSLGGENVSVPLVSVGGDDHSDYEYELQGVLVHAGIAAGGHYYSFIRDVCDTSANGKEEKWYRFNDEDVSTFNPENIPTSCFGGTYSSTSGMHDIIEEDRSANALMLFFRKVKPTQRESKSEEATTGSAGGAGAAAPTGPTPEEMAALNAVDPLINGYQAFEREVWETNMKYLVAEYVLDTDLHNFVRSILAVMCKDTSSIEEGAGALSLATFPAEIKVNELASFGCHFFIDVVLHCKDRSGVKLWMEVLASYFKKFPTSADWFMLHIMTRTQCSWLRDYLLHATDAMACSSFVQLIVAAGLSIVEHAKTQSSGDRAIADKRVLDVVDSVLDMLPLVPLSWRTADELFIALRDLAAIPSVAEYLVSKDVIAKLAYFAIPDKVPPHIRAVYETATTVSKDFNNLLQTVFEVIAVLMGIPQITRSPLIEEDPKTLLSQLSRPVVIALTTIFKENSTGSKMDFRDVLSFMEKVTPNQKQANMQARNILDRFGDRTSTSLALDGFLQHYLKTAIYNPKFVWKDLHFFGFQNDLTRISGGSASTASEEATASTYSPASDHLMSIMPGTSKDCLLRLDLYEAAMYDAEAAAVAVAKRFCFGDGEASISILQQSLSRLNKTIIEFWSTDTELILNFIRALMSLNDNLFSVRMHELVFGDFGYLTKYYFESQRSVSNAGRHSGYPHEAKMWADTYLKQFRSLCASSEAAMHWVEEHVLKDPSHAWLASSIQPTKGIEIDDITSKIIIVSDAGISEIEGQYLYVRMHNNAGMFEKAPTLYGDRLVTFTIYRCRLQNKKHAWYISYTSDGSLPGTTSDIDFYTASAMYQEGRPETNDVLPPTTMWTTSSEGVLPPPNVIIIDGVPRDIDSDRSMEVVNDDDSSQPDTDIPALNPNDDSLDMDDYPPSYGGM